MVHRLLGAIGTELLSDPSIDRFKMKLTGALRRPKTRPGQVPLGLPARFQGWLLADADTKRAEGAATPFGAPPQLHPR